VRTVFQTGIMLLVVTPLFAGCSGHRSQTIRVPQDESDIRRAVARAAAGDTIVVARGTYRGGVSVPAGKNDLTIRGVDRNAVVLDGRNEQRNAISVHADRVAVLNLSAHNFLENAFYWEDVKGFRASYLTAWDIQGYGIYTEGSSDGTIDHDYVSGAADAAYYVGECRPCRTTITHVVARRSAVGYSGTNASGSLVIRNSLWDENGAGILPNTYANEKLPPQENIVIVGNIVRGSGRAPVPIHTPLAGFIGIGIAIAGGNGNTVRDNHVTDSERYGITIFPTAHHVSFRPAGLTLRPYWHSHGNRVIGNRVSGSGRADLALASGVGDHNCFAGNAASSMSPRQLQTDRCASRGDAAVAAALTAPVQQMFEETISRRKPPDYSSLPAPPAQPNLP